MIDKRAIHRLLLERLESDLQSVESSQRSAQSGATHPEARQEDAKDTRAIEGQYLARGLAERVEALREAVARCRRMELASFGPDDPVATSALVALEDGEGIESHYFLTPWGGGESLTLGDVTVRTLTPTSPLGRALSGRLVDDEVEVALPGRTLSATITRIS